MKASSWPLATSCSSLKRNISALRIAFVKTNKRHNNNCISDSNKSSKDCWCRGDEKDEDPTPIKRSLWQAKHTASDSLV